MKVSASIKTTMITRRRSCRMSTPEESSWDVQVDVPERDEEAPQSPQSFTTGMDLNNWSEFEDLVWSDRDATDFDIALANLGVCDIKAQDSGNQESVGDSEEKLSPNEQKRTRNPSSHVSNKNAIAARQNRLKKKEYVNNLERKVGVLTAENGSLKQENCQLTKRVEELEDETRYLRAVLANQSVLAQLLSRLSGANGMKLSSSLFQNSNPNDHDYALPRKRAKVKEKETSGGVCLHVDQNHVSVEFCRECAESASSSLRL